MDGSCCAACVCVQAAAWQVACRHWPVGVHPRTHGQMRVRARAWVDAAQVGGVLHVCSRQQPIKRRRMGAGAGSVSGRLKCSIRVGATCVRATHQWCEFAACSWGRASTQHAPCWQHPGGQTKKDGFYSSLHVKFTSWRAFKVCAGMFIRCVLGNQMDGGHARGGRSGPSDAPDEPPGTDECTLILFHLVTDPRPHTSFLQHLHSYCHLHSYPPLPPHTYHRTPSPPPLAA